MSSDRTKVTITTPDNLDMSLITGPGDSFLRAMEERFSSDISIMNNEIDIEGTPLDVQHLVALFTDLIKTIQSGQIPTRSDLDKSMFLLKEGDFISADQRDDILRTSRGKTIRPKTQGQKRYVDAIRSNTITFGIGPAGTGKTYLAMAMAIAALKRKEIRRIVLCRPVVEAGESLGFLPGTLEEKVDPYVRPLYDALMDMTDREKGENYFETGTIEIAPLAFMRGRTLSDAFVILDEAQNTTKEQMKMFLTRLGFGSKFVVTGDVTQIDLPKSTSGLMGVKSFLGDIDGIAFVDFDKSDVVRHELVAKIVEAYDANDKN